MDANASLSQEMVEEQINEVESELTRLKEMIGELTAHHNDLLAAQRVLNRMAERVSGSRTVQQMIESVFPSLDSEPRTIREIKSAVEEHLEVDITIAAARYAVKKLKDEGKIFANDGNTYSWNDIFDLRDDDDKDDDDEITF